MANMADYDQSELEEKALEETAQKAKELQRRAIRKSYATAYRKAAASETAKAVAQKEATAVAVRKTVRTTQTIQKWAKEPGFWIALLLGLVALALVMMMGATTSMTTMLSGAMTQVVSTSYTSEDSDLLATESAYAALETALRTQISLVEQTMPDYDDYEYSLNEIGHNPYILTAYLTAKYQVYTADDVATELANLYTMQYNLTFSVLSETQGEGEDEETILTLLVDLVNNPLETFLRGQLTDDQQIIYDALLETQGNKPGIFDSVYNTGSSDQAIDYQVPSHYLTDSQFGAMIAEAEKYLGYPYVWGGSSPSTSFDCSGFVCWVINQSGVGYIPRTTAQGIFNATIPITASEAQPGDIVFFEGTYDTTSTVTHVGIYVGDGMMIHCGNPIGYVSMDSGYWAEHFYCFGRLPSMAEEGE